METLKAHDITLQGPRVRLRPMTEADWDCLLRWNNDPQVLYYAEGDEVTERSLEEVEAIYRGASQRGYCFIIEVGGQPVGECWLQKLNLAELAEQFAGRDCRRIDLMIGEKGLWGQGLGTEVIGLLTRFGFEEEGADLIFGCGIGDHNPRSRRAFEKNGYVPFRELPRPQGGKAKTSWDLVIVREERE